MPRLDRTRLIAIAILLIAGASLAAYAYPGFMSFDSVLQLREARAGTYTDWHPPAMALLWRYVDKIIPGPFGMLLVQLSTFVVGAYLLARRYLSPVAAAVFALLLLWFPPMASTMAVVWKDCLMFGFLMLGIALMLDERWRLRIAGLFLLYAASAMRHNGFTITFAPVILCFVWPPFTGWKRYALSTSIWLGITVAAFGTNSLLTDRLTHPWHGSTAVADIVGTLRYAPYIDDGELRRELAGIPAPTLDNFQRHTHRFYDSRLSQFAVYNSGLMSEPTTAEHRHAIEHAWRYLVRTYPGAYLRHRSRLAREILGMRGAVGQSAWVGVEAGGFDLARYEPGPLRAELNRIEWFLGDSWLMRPFIYVLLILVPLPVVVMRRERLLIALALSALLSEIALFFLAPTPDFRYSAWMLPVAALMWVFGVLEASRYIKRRRQSS